MTEFTGVKGTKYDLSRLEELIKSGSIKNWQVEIDPTSSNTNRSVQVITSENSQTILYQEYRKNPTVQQCVFVRLQKRKIKF